MDKTVIQTIEEQAWIDRVADPVQRAVRGVLSRAPRVAAFLHGGPLGHPLHAALVSIPLGAWTTALVLDGLELAGRGRRYRRAADVATALGVGGAAVAALPGLADWSRTEGGARRVGFVHATLNALMLGVYAGSLVARARRRRRVGIGLAFAGYALGGASAWLGGELAFGFGVGVRPRPEGRPEAPAEGAPASAPLSARP